MSVKKKLGKAVVAEVKQGIKKKVAEKKPAPKLSAKGAPMEPLVRQVREPFLKPNPPTFKKYVSTLEAASKERYTDTELDEFRKLITAKLDEARKDLSLLTQKYGRAETDGNGRVDTDPGNVKFDEASMTIVKEEDAVLVARHEKFIRDLETALLRIQNKTYGICAGTGRLISKERLRLVPHTTRSVEAKAA